MSLSLKEMPGAITPWTGINQLLQPDERFEINSQLGLKYLLAPKQPSQLAALLFILNDQKIGYKLQENEMHFHTDSFCLVSARSFKTMQFHEQGVVEAGTGCSLSEVHQYLYQFKQEVAIEETPLDSTKQSIGSVLLSGTSSGLRLCQESFRETILGVDLATAEGCQIKWGSMQKGGCAGPSLHRLLYGLKAFPGIIMKIYLKTYPVPPSRLRLTWSFDNCQSLWEHFHLLKHFSCSWEILDCVISAKASDRCFIFAQISGLQEEMESFSKVCPGISYATQKGEREQMKRYLQQLGLKAILSGADQQLKAGEYLWIQEGGEKVWLLCGKQCDISDDCSSQWKKRLMTSLQ